MQSVDLNISQSEADLINALATLVASVKAKKSLSELLALEIPAFIKISGEFGAIAGDFVASDKTDLGYYTVKTIEAALK